MKGSSCTKTLRPDGSGHFYLGSCPFCGFELQVENDSTLTVSMMACEHFVRRWRVSADRRVRVEWRQGRSTLQESAS
jgi:hypothetical protein